MAFLKHVKVTINGVEDVYAENFTFNEGSEHQLKRYAGGAYATEKSNLASMGTISFDCGPMPSTTGQANYRDLLRKGLTVTVAWIGGDNRITAIDGLVKTCNETDPSGVGHSLSVEIEGAIVYPASV